MWLEAQSVTSPQEVTARHVREYLAQLTGNGKSDNTVHDNAKSYKDPARSWHTGELHSLTCYFCHAESSKEAFACIVGG
ncbi:MAG: hypothetical protein MZU91_02160 [Desulfosudis oleivorans]|nr:hypothetical protein [Desulfosudis oleivorans]